MLLTMFTIISVAQPLENPHTCFLINNSFDHIIYAHGTGYDERITPCSTFKIVLSLIGFDSGILINESSPEMPYENYPALFDVWKQPHNPSSWIANSCVWYSQQLTQKLGLEKLKKYLALFDYGNQDLSGDPEKNNGLTRAWLSSSLTISPAEQIIFLRKLIHNELPVSKQAIHLTKKLLFIKQLSNGWQLFGKTGGGYENPLNPDEGKISWLVGWIEREGTIITYVYRERYSERAPSRSELCTMVEKLIAPYIS